MNYYFTPLKLVLCFLLPLQLLAQPSRYLSLEEALKNPEKARYLYVEGDSASLQQLSLGAQKLRNIAGIAIDGKVELEAELWESFSHFAILEQVILRNNELKNLEIRSTTTMKELWISGSPEIPSGRINATLENCNYLQVLRLHDFQTSLVPPAIKNLSLLVKLEISRSNWPFEQVVTTCKDLKQLKQLFLPDNGLAEIGNTIKFLPTVQHLDLSGNNLSTISNKIKKLSTLDTLVLNRNVFSDLQVLIPLLQQSKVDLLILQSDTLQTNEEIEYALPGKDIIWQNEAFNRTDFVLPSGTNVLIKDFKTEELKHKKLDAKSVTSSDVSLYSPAFIRFEQLQFPQPLAAIDTLCFNSRYQDSSYIYTVKIENQNETGDGYFYPLKLDKAHGTYYKKNRRKKIEHEKQSHVRFEFTDPTESAENKVYVTVILQEINTIERSDLDAFRDVIWEMIGYSSNKDFEAEIMKNKTWSDFRITKKEDGEEYTFILKGRFETIELRALPNKKGKLSDVKFVEKDVPKMYKTYQKELIKTAAKFDKELSRTMSQAERKFIKEINAKWELVVPYMSEEEKLLSRYDWMPYYQKIKGNEFGLIAQEKLEILYLSRLLEARGFTSSKGNDFYVGQKWISFRLKTSQGEVLPVQDYCLVDMDQRLVRYFPATKSPEFLHDGYHHFILVAKLADGRFVLLNDEQLADLYLNQELVIPETTFVDRKISNSNLADKINYWLDAQKY